MTQQRLDMLDSVQRGAVTYNRRTGHWNMDGEPAAGWTGRTLSTLKRNEYIVTTQGNPMDTVALTERGKDALA